MGHSFLQCPNAGYAGWLFVHLHWLTVVVGVTGSQIITPAAAPGKLSGGRHMTPAAIVLLGTVVLLQGCRGQSAGAGSEGPLLQGAVLPVASPGGGGAEIFSTGSNQVRGIAAPLSAQGSGVCSCSLGPHAVEGMGFGVLPCTNLGLSCVTAGIGKVGVHYQIMNAMLSLQPMRNGLIFSTTYLRLDCQ